MPMIHKQHVPAYVCDDHKREPKLIPNEELRALRAAHQTANATAK